MPPPGKETGIGREPASPIAAIGVLSLGLLLPVGAGPLTDRAVALLTSSVEGQTKTITLVRNGQAEPVRTRAETVADLLTEQNIGRSPEDVLDVDPASPLTDGETIAYRAAVPVTIVVDGVTQTIRTAAATVAEALEHEGVAFDRHDRIVPAATDPITGDETIQLEHVNSWIERVRKPLTPAVEHRLSFDLAVGRVKVMQKGVPGQREIQYRRTACLEPIKMRIESIVKKHITGMDAESTPVARLFIASGEHNGRICPCMGMPGLQQPAGTPFVACRDRHEERPLR